MLGEIQTSRSESKNAFYAVLSTEGRVVGLCWEHLQAQGPKNDLKGAFGLVD